MLGPLEETILCAIVGLGGESYSVAINEHIEEQMGRDLSPGSLLTTLYRMEEKGFVSSRFSEPIPQRGGRKRRMFKIEAAGQHALRQREIFAKLRTTKPVAVIA